MNKSDIIDTVAADHELTKVKARQIIDQVFGFIGTDLKKTGRFAYPSLGTFTVTQRAARKGRNPKTGEPLKIKASKGVRFRPAPSLKSMVEKVKIAK
ncbi:MAG TPA: HU family DNA-binding protein [Noviherbaspirillum sp.]|nr:HU family DNA-binding protein [Noviherbaspirillum sp.]